MTGGHTDYKQMDRDNVLILSRVLQLQKNAEGDKAHG